MESVKLVECLEEKMKEIEGENLCLQWTNHQHVLQTVMSALRNQEYFSDITLAAEGQFFHAHKFVLSTCSSFFEDLLGQTPCKHPVVVLPDTPPQLLSKLLDFMYLGNTEVQKEDFMKLMVIARRLRIKGLLGPEDITLAEEESQEIKEEISIKEEHFDGAIEEFVEEDFISESKFSEAYQEHILDDTDFSGEVYKANDGPHRMYASSRTKKCPYCSKIFDNILNLKEHVSKHQGRRVHNCHSCEYKAFSPFDLKRHMLKHSGYDSLKTYKRELPSKTGQLIKCERPFGCYYCPARFIQKVHMTTHVKRMHPTKSIFGPQSKVPGKRTMSEASNKINPSNKKQKMMPKKISSVLRKTLREDVDSAKKRGRGRPKLEPTDSTQSRISVKSSANQRSSINSSPNKTRSSGSTYSLQNDKQQKREK